MVELYRSKYFVWNGDRTRIRGSIEPFYPFLDQVYECLRADFGFGVDHKLPITVKVQESESCPGGIGGSSGPEGLVFCAGNWAENHWCYGLLIQELVNYFTGEGVSGGWPNQIIHIADHLTKIDEGPYKWWADNHSPFPILISVEVLKQLGKTAMSNQREAIFKNDFWYACFRKLHTGQGFNLWRALFALLREYKVDLNQYQEPTKSVLLMSMISFFKLAV
jgi:hypothetical protein